MSDRVVTAHVPRALAEEVDALAKQLDRPRGWIVKEALSLLIGLERERRELTLEALRDVDAGRTLSHSDLEAWARTLGHRKTARRR